jgi:hypothetical protein
MLWEWFEMYAMPVAVVSADSLTLFSFLLIRGYQCSCGGNIHLLCISLTQNDLLHEPKCADLYLS